MFHGGGNNTDWFVVVAFVFWLLFVLFELYVWVWPLI